MITLTDFKKFEAIEAELKQFLADKCSEYDEATAYSTEDYYKDVNREKLDCWEFQEDKIVIWFNTESRECEFYTYDLPLDILFDPDFKTILKERTIEERRLETLKSIEVQRKRDENKKVEEISRLKELMAKYPDVVNEGV